MLTSLTDLSLARAGPQSAAQPPPGALPQLHRPPHRHHLHPGRVPRAGGGGGQGGDLVLLATLSPSSWLSGARGQEEDGADGVLAAGGLPAHGDHPARHGGVQGQPLQRWKQPRDPSCVSSICIHMTDGSLTLEVGLDSRLYMPDQPIQVR